MNVWQAPLAQPRSAPLAGLCVGYDSSIGCDMVSGREAFTVLCEAVLIKLNWVDALILEFA